MNSKLGGPISAPLFLGAFTRLLNGQIFSTSSAAGLSAVARSSSISPRHFGQSTKVSLAAA